jgi:hypothetical protein
MPLQFRPINRFSVLRAFSPVVLRKRGLGRAILTTRKFKECATLTIFAEDLIGQSISSGKFEENYGDKYSRSSGYMDSSYHFLAYGRSISSGYFNTKLHLIVAGSSRSSGTMDYRYVAALAELACYVLNLDTGRTYQYGNYAFNGVCRFNNVLLGAKSTKVHDLETAATSDDGTAIPAYIDFGKLNFGIPNFHAWRSIAAMCDGGTQVTFTFTNEAGTAYSYTISKDVLRGLPRTLKDRSFSLRIDNVSGEQITIRQIHGKVNVEQLKGA